jgi:hypothetical protein
MILVMVDILVYREIIITRKTKAGHRLVVGSSSERVEAKPNVPLIILDKY